jgi:hypothetical protein
MVAPTDVDTVTASDGVESDRATAGSPDLTQLLDTYLNVDPTFHSRLQFDFTLDAGSGSIRHVCSTAPPAAEDPDTPHHLPSRNRLKLAVARDYGILDGPNPLPPAPPAMYDGRVGITPQEEDTAEFVDDVADVFCVAPHDRRRWRTFVHAVDWKPDQHQDFLLKQRAYHARSAYELSLLTELCNREWLTRRTIESLRYNALLNLRYIEIHMACFQLSEHQVGIRPDPRKMYEAAVFAHSVHLYLFDRVSAFRQNKKGRGEVMALKPSTLATPKELVACIDVQVHSIYLFLKVSLANAEISTMLTQLEECKPLCQRLALVIKALDAIFVVMAPGSGGTRSKDPTLY